VNPRTSPRVVLSLVSATLVLSIAGGPDRVSALPSIAVARSCPGADASPRTETLDRAGQAALCLLNAERAARKLTALVLDPRLQAAAERHSRDMARRDFFDHVTPGGTGVVARVGAAGFPSSGATLAENIAWGSGAFGQPAMVVKGWMRSAPHRATILNPALRHVGVGIALDAPEPAVRDGATYTADFAGAGSRRTARARPARSRRSR
jgi:uncharacterized protein YkwD